MKHLMAAFFLLSTFSLLVFAEVPEHNPGLDSQCNPGFQYSRGPATCKQANCPPGAGRTYTYDCSCWVSEWGGTPKVTCYQNQLAVKCLPAGGNCNTAKSGFDPLTGDCKTGYEWKDDFSDCIAVLPESMSCKVVDLDGNPVTGVPITYGEYGTSETQPNVHSNSQTDANGEVQFQVTDRHSRSVNFIFRGGNGYYKGSRRIYTDDQTNCTITAYTNDQIERYIKREFTAFLQNACLPQDMINKVNQAKFEFGAGVSTSQYDGGKMRISSGELDGGDWDSLQRTIVHEFGHYLSEQIMDPDKNVGGPHNNWVPNSDKHWYQFGKSDPEELAFEEGLADFLAMQYFKSKGQVYQSDFATFDRAQQFLASSGRGNGSKTEGVVTSFLYEYYNKAPSTDFNGPAHAAGDFIRAVTYESRVNGGTPARTIKQFIVSKIKSDTNEQSNACTPQTGTAPDLPSLSSKYGFDSDESFRLIIGLLKQDEINNDAEILSPEPDLLTPGSLIGLGVPYEIRTNRGVAVLESLPSDYASSGTVRRIILKPGTNQFQIDQGNVVVLNNGTAYVLDASIRTPRIRINHQNTEYVVEVAGNKDTITVLNGTIEASELNGDRTVILSTGETVDYSPDTGFSTPRAVSLSSVHQFWRNSTHRSLLPCLPGFIFAALLLLFAHKIKHN